MKHLLRIYGQNKSTGQFETVERLIFSKSLLDAQRKSELISADISKNFIVLNKIINFKTQNKMTQSTKTLLNKEQCKSQRQLNRLEAMQSHLLKKYVSTSTIYNACYLNKRIIKLEKKLNRLRWRIGRIA